MSSGGGREEVEAFEDTLPVQGQRLPGAPPENHARIGPYQLLESIGEGGMGEVWLAE